MSEERAATPAAEGTAASGPAAPVRTVPVLLYHAVMEEPPAWIAEFTVTPRDFGEHLRAIEDSGRTPLTVGTLLEGLSGTVPLPERPVVITFDDGFADLPGPTAETLAEHAMPSTAYLTTGALDPKGRGERCLLPPAPMMGLRQAAGLEEYGVEIGAHTVSHAQLDTLSSGALRYELRSSKAVLEQELGHEVVHLAYPHGYNSPAVRRAAREAGYDSAVAVRHAISSTGDDTYRIARLILRRRHTAADMARWMRGAGAPLAPFPDSPRTVGWRMYRRARAAVRGPVFAG